MRLMLLYRVVLLCLSCLWSFAVDCLAMKMSMSNAKKHGHSQFSVPNCDGI